MASVRVFTGQTSLAVRQPPKNGQILNPGLEKFDFKWEIYIFWSRKQYQNVKKWLKFAIQSDFSYFIWLFWFEQLMLLIIFTGKPATSLYYPFLPIEESSHNQKAISYMGAYLWTEFNAR